MVYNYRNGTNRPLTIAGPDGRPQRVAPGKFVMENDATGRLTKRATSSFFDKYVGKDGLDRVRFGAPLVVNGEGKVEGLRRGLAPKPIHATNPKLVGQLVRPHAGTFSPTQRLPKQKVALGVEMASEEDRMAAAVTAAASRERLARRDRANPAQAPDAVGVFMDDEFDNLPLPANLAPSPSLAQAVKAPPSQKEPAADADPEVAGLGFVCPVCGDVYPATSVLNDHVAEDHKEDYLDYAALRDAGSLERAPLLASLPGTKKKGKRR